jgi:hypothetical protein
VKKRLKDSEFVLAWEQSGCVTEVVARLRALGYGDMTDKRVRAVAYSLRRLGVELKRMPRPTFPAVPSALDLVKYGPDREKMRHFYALYLKASLASQAFSLKRELAAKLEDFRKRAEAHFRRTSGWPGGSSAH